MSEGPILVTTPTGNVGKEVVRSLLARGATVRAGVRDPRAARLPNGVEAVHLDFDDPATHGPAVAGARGLFLLRPTQISRVSGTLNRLVDAAGAAGVGHCVFLSVSGAERQRWLPHRKVEQHLERGPLGWTFLRANHFMQNLTGPYHAAIAAGCLRLPAGDGRIAFVDCADIGEVAAMALCAPAGHRNVAYHLTGPEAVGFLRLTQLLTDALGRQVRYEPISAPRYARSLRAEGASLPFTAILTALHVGVRRGGAAEVDPTLGRVLGHRPQSVEDFVSRHASELARD